METNNQTKVCKRCGKDQPLENFRKYYGGREGYYTFCKTCEKIEARRKYLMRLGDKATPEQLEEIAKIDKLYDMQHAAGLSAPRHRTKTKDLVDSLLQEATGKVMINRMIEANANEDL